MLGRSSGNQAIAFEWKPGLDQAGGLRSIWSRARQTCEHVVLAVKFITVVTLHCGHCHRCVTTAAVPVSVRPVIGLVRRSVLVCSEWNWRRRSSCSRKYATDTQGNARAQQHSESNTANVLMNRCGPLRLVTAKATGPQGHRARLGLGPVLVLNFLYPSIRVRTAPIVSVRVRASS